MAIDVETKDCTALGDAQLEEMADCCVGTSIGYEIGLLSKQVEKWVLCTQARDRGRLRGFCFGTLERIGGTPSVLIGLASVVRTSKRDAVLRGIVGDQLRRAQLAFPDEDVLVGTRVVDPGGLESFKSLTDVVPRAGHKASGEERAWGRRLAKRFGIENGRYDDRAFTAIGDGTTPCVLDHQSVKAQSIDEDVAVLFASFDADLGDSLIAFGWAMAEDLARLARYTA